MPRTVQPCQITDAAADSAKYTALVEQPLLLPNDSKTLSYMQVRFKLFLHQLKQDRHEEELRAHKQCAYKHVSITSYQMLPNTGSALGKKKPNKPTHKLTVSIIPCEISLFFLFLDKKKKQKVKNLTELPRKKDHSGDHCVVDTLPVQL